MPLQLTIITGTIYELPLLLFNLTVLFNYIRQGKLYWTDTATYKIMRSDFSGSDITTVLNLEEGAIPGKYNSSYRYLIIYDMT